MLYVSDEDTKANSLQIFNHLLQDDAKPRGRIGLIRLISRCQRDAVLVSFFLCLMVFKEHCNEDTEQLFVPFLLFWEIIISWPYAASELLAPSLEYVLVSKMSSLSHNVLLTGVIASIMLLPYGY